MNKTVECYNCHHEVEPRCPECDAVLPLKNPDGSGTPNYDLIKLSQNQLNALKMLLNVSFPLSVYDFTSEMFKQGIQYIRRNASTVNYDTDRSHKVISSLLGLKRSHGLWLLTISEQEDNVLVDKAYNTTRPKMRPHYQIRDRDLAARLIAHPEIGPSLNESHILSQTKLTNIEENYNEN